MKKMINIRNGIIIILCVTIVFMGIGFIILSVELKTKKDEVYTLNLAFTKVEKASSVKGSNIEPVSTAEIMSGGMELSMNFTLNAIHDEVTYIATVENKGTLAAEVVDLMQSPNFDDPVMKSVIYPVSVTVSDLVGKIIPPGEEKTVKIVVYYNPSNMQVTKKNFNYKLGLITKSR